MDSLFLLQFGCFIYMVMSAAFIGISRCHVCWENRRYEHSRWMLFAAMMILATHFLLQMICGWRASGDDLGAVINILVYAPCVMLVAMAIYNMEAVQDNRKTLARTGILTYVAIVISFVIGIVQYDGMHIGPWLYVMQILFLGNNLFFTWMILAEMKKRRRLYDKLTGSDLIPYQRYSKASLYIVCIPSIFTPLVILSTQLLLIFGPILLFALFFFNMSFVALGNSYHPTEALIDDEAENEADASEGKSTTHEPPLTDRQKAEIKSKLEQWCSENNYKDSAVNMLILSRTIDVPKHELSQYFATCLNTTFRIWLSDIRFKAAQEMMRAYPDYSNAVISIECGFSSRTHLYRVFKLREQCTPTEWRENKTKNKRKGQK